MPPPVVLVRSVDLPRSGRRAVVISLNRPKRHNCFNMQVIRELSAAFRSVAEEVRRSAEAHGDGGGGHDLAAVVFTGEGRSFCAGADLTDPPSPLHQSSDLPHHLALNPVHHMGTVGVPVIAALKGHVVTGGFELALACDILVGDATTRFRDTHVKFGLAPCWGLSQRLQRRVGPGRAQMVSLGAGAVGGQQALGWGLLDDLAAEGTSALDRALEIADQIGTNNPAMVERYRRALVEGGAMDLARGLQRERELGMAHYVEVVGDNSTFEGAKDFMNDKERPRSKL